MITRTICLILALIVCGVASPRGQKRVIEVPLFVDYAPPPATPDEMVHVVDAVVLAKYSGKKRLIERVFAGRPVARSTAHTFEIAEFLKFDPRLPSVGETYELILFGGEKESPTEVLRDRRPDIDDLTPNATYAVFLQWNQRTNQFFLPWHEESLYRVMGNGAMRSLLRRGTNVNTRDLSAFLTGLTASQGR